MLESVHLKVWSHVAWHAGLGIKNRYLAVSCAPQSGVSHRVNLVMEHVEEATLTLLLDHKALC